MTRRQTSGFLSFKDHALEEEKAGPEGPADAWESCEILRISYVQRRSSDALIRDGDDDIIVG